MDQSDSILFEMRKVAQEISENQNPETAQILIKLASQASEIIPSKEQFSKILEVLHSSMKLFLESNNTRTAGLLADKIIDLLEARNEGIAEGVADVPLEFFKLSEGVTIGEDLLNRLISFWEDENKLERCADALNQVGFLLHNLRRHEHAVAVLGKSVTYYQDLEEGKKQIEDLILKLLDIARSLALKNDSNDQHYIQKANEISNMTGIKVEGYAIEAAHSSYAEHLLNKSSTMVRGNFKYYGRTHKRKRKIFGKK
ncbi:MAG: hypothetical protein ACXAC7_20875 [Candidatus Hodarchaeales archaeon]|jgi:hypothetical protein